MHYSSTKKKKDNARSPTVRIDNATDDEADIEVTVGQNDSFMKSPKSIELPISSAAKSHRRCIVCKKENTKRTRLIVIPEEAKTQAFIDQNVLIASNSRSCKDHLIGKYFKQHALNELKAISSTTQFNRKDLTDLLERTRNMIKSAGKLNFDTHISLSDDDYVNLTGLTMEQFDSVCSVITKIRASEVRSPRTCLAILLVKLRTGLSNSILGTLFSLTKHQIQRSIHTARIAMMDQFVSSYLGFRHISHAAFVANHTTPIAKQLFGGNEENVAVLVLDGTYVYIQKSSHHRFQKMTYNMHKSRCLVKPMMVVGSDGYILSVLGPYYSDSANNDASITKHAIKTNADEIKDWLQTKDVLIVDRGFRDVLEFLRNLGFQCEMPCFLEKGQKQHSTEEANSSRLVTKVCWVVESANGRLKQWKFLDRVVSNHYVPYIGDFVRIVCSLINCFRVPLISDFAYDELGLVMLEKSKEKNHVQQYVDENNLIKRKVIYKEVNGSNSVDDFPRMTLQSLRDLTLGVYQLKQASMYTEEHLSTEGEYALFVCKDRLDLLRVKLSSRHSSSKTYNVWVEYTDDNVTGWYCTCKLGTRIVGCCAHVASVIWYLSYSRWNEHTDKSYKCKMMSSLVDSRDAPDTDTDAESDASSVINEEE